MVDRLGAVAGAAGAHADPDARPAREQLREAGLAHGERGDVLDLHRALSLRSISTSRSSACSLTCPRIAWFTSTTGASAHWPKQATVRIVKLRSGVVSSDLVGAVGSLLQAEPELHALEQRPRSARVAGGAAADRDGVAPCGSRLKSAKNVATL